MNTASLKTLTFSLSFMLSVSAAAVAETVAVAPFEVPEGQDSELAMFVCETFADLLEEEGITVIRSEDTARAITGVQQKKPGWSASEVRAYVVDKLSLSTLYEGSLRKMGSKYYASLKPYGDDGKAGRTIRVKRANEAGIESMADELICGVYGREPPDYETARASGGAAETDEAVSAYVDPSISGSFITIAWRCPMSHTRGEYKGAVVKGYPQGFGEMTFVTGEKYSGQFVKGYMHGKGRVEFTSGNVYKGDMTASLIHGTGTLSYTSGDAYTGEFEAGDRTGIGVLRLKSGAQLKGYWTEDYLHGEVLYTSSNGRKERRLFNKGKDVTPQPEQQSSSGGGILSYVGGIAGAGVGFGATAFGGGIGGGMLLDKNPGLMDAYNKYEEAMAPIQRFNQVKSVLDELGGGSGAQQEEAPPPPPDDPFSGGMK